MMRPGISIALLALILATNNASPAPSIDWLYPAGAKRGTTVEVTAGGKFDQWPAKWVCSNPAVAIKALPTKGLLAVTVAPEALPGPCLIRAIDETGAGNAKPFVVGILPELKSREPDDELASALLVPVPAVVHGRLEKSGDVDCFAVELKKGQTLVASLMANHLLASPMDAVLQVVSPQGSVLTQNNDASNLDPAIAFQALENGTHIVRLFAFPSMPDSSIRFAGGDAYVYRLTLTTGPFARHAWPLSVKADKKEGLCALGWSLGDFASSAKKLASNPSGQVLAGSDNWANFVPLMLADSEPVLWRQGLDKPLDLPVSLSVKALGKEAAILKVKFAKDTEYQLAVWSSGLELNMFPSVRLIDPAGKLLQTLEPKELHADLDTTFKAATEGEYRIEIREAHSIISDRHACLVHLSKLTPNFNLKLGGEAVVAEAGKAATVQVTVARMGGLTGPPVFRLEGLPAQIPWSTEPDKDPAKPFKINIGPVKDAKAFTGPVKVFAKVGNLPEKQAWTGSSYPGLQVMETWLHLPPPKPVDKPSDTPKKVPPK